MISTEIKALMLAMRGFALSNLKYIRQWVKFYSYDNEIGQQAVGQLVQIP